MKKVLILAVSITMLCTLLYKHTSIGHSGFRTEEEALMEDLPIDSSSTLYIVPPSSPSKIKMVDTFIKGLDTIIIKHDTSEFSGPYDVQSEPDN